MTFPLPIPDSLRRAIPPGTGVLLGLSGGVDSAVSLALLRALDCEVQCVTFKNFCYSEVEDFTDQSCCSLDAIEEAVGRARAEGVVGAQETPYLLAHLAEATGGRTVAVNVALLEGNAGVAARLAVALRRIDG